MQSENGTRRIRLFAYDDKSKLGRWLYEVVREKGKAASVFSRAKKVPDLEGTIAYIPLNHHPKYRKKCKQVAEELRQMQRDLDFDFGKFDYAIVNCQLVPYNTNRTPTLSNFPREHFLPRIRLLAEGIRAYS